jgi:putative transcriptional regulator
MNAPEPETKPARPRFFERVQSGLLQTIAYAQGEAEARVTTLTIPDPPPTYDAERIRTLRTGLGFSQPYFSRLLNVSPKTVQSWEQGTRIPSQSSARLLQLIENPHLLDSLRRPQQIPYSEAAD